jgi:hypothetical protein
MNTKMSASSQFKINVKDLHRKITNGRKLVEQSRSTNIRNIEKEIKKIIEKEKEYSLTVLEEIIPVSVNVNDEAINNFKNLIPITFEIKKKVEKEVINPIVVHLDESLDGNISATIDEDSDEEIEDTDINELLN